MEVSVEKPRMAWQPLTARGVAAFAQARLGRLLIVQFIVALLLAAAVIWFLHRAWFPVIQAAIEKLPAQGQIRGGRLQWGGHWPESLAEGRCLAVVVDLKHQGGVRSPAHVQVELGEDDFRVISLLGFVAIPYPKGWIVAVNRAELNPWWGAWAPPILAMVAGAVVAGLMLSWAALATLYFGPAWLIGFFANRHMNLRESWRLAGAALMPGALLLAAAVVCYGLAVLDLVGFMAAAAANLVIGWGYLLAAALRAPPHPEAAAAKANPFVASR